MKGNAQMDLNLTMSMGENFQYVEVKRLVCVSIYED